MIVHNVSSEIPIKINRPSVTLYGVAPNNAYNVHVHVLPLCIGLSAESVSFTVPNGQPDLFMLMEISKLVFKFVLKFQILLEFERIEKRTCSPILKNNAGSM